MGKAVPEKGLEGIKLALSLLKENYASGAAHSAAAGAAAGIVDLLETIESDMTKAPAALIANEEASTAEYDRMSKGNEVKRTPKVQSVKYKLKESKQLNQATSDNSADRSTVQAVLQQVAG